MLNGQRWPMAVNFPQGGCGLEDYFFMMWIAIRSLAYFRCSIIFLSSQFSCLFSSFQSVLTSLICHPLPMWSSDMVATLMQAATRSFCTSIDPYWEALCLGLLLLLIACFCLACPPSLQPGLNKWSVTTKGASSRYVFTEGIDTSHPLAR